MANLEKIIENIISKNHEDTYIVITSGILDKKSKLRILADDVRASLNGCEIEGNIGDIVEVSEALSVFLTLKGWAEIVS